MPGTLACCTNATVRLEKLHVTKSLELHDTIEKSFDSRANLCSLFHHEMMACEGRGLAVGS